MACPVRTTSSWPNESRSPAAMRICSRTRSSPVTASVTVCSTWIRVFISRKKYEPVLGREGLRRFPPTGSRPRAQRRQRRRRSGRGARRRRGRGRLLEELLVPPLNRAVALAEMNDVAVGVGEHLHLDVPRIFQVPLHVDRRSAKYASPSRRADSNAPCDLIRRRGHLETLATAARGRLDRDRVADLLGNPKHLLDALGGLGRCRG